MPTYQYRCTECGSELEAVQRFTDPSLTDCPDCTGQLRKVFNAVGVVFKGSGFYRTDSRNQAKASSEATSPGSSEGGSGSTEKTSTGSTSAEKSGSKQPVGAGSGASSGSRGSAGSSSSAGGSSTAA